MPKKVRESPERGWRRAMTGAPADKRASARGGRGDNRWQREGPPVFVTRLQAFAIRNDIFSACFFSPQRGRGMRFVQVYHEEAAKSHTFFFLANGHNGLLVPNGPTRPKSVSRVLRTHVHPFLRQIPPNHTRESAAWRLCSNPFLVYWLGATLPC